MLHLIITIGQKKRLDTANLDSYILRQEKWLSSYSNVYCKRVRKPCDLAQQTLHLLRNPWTGCSNCWRSPCRKDARRIDSHKTLPEAFNVVLVWRGLAPRPGRDCRRARTSRANNVNG